MRHNILGIIILSIPLLSATSCGKDSAADNTSGDSSAAKQAAVENTVRYTPQEQRMYDQMSELLNESGTGIGKYSIGDAPSMHLPHASLNYGGKLAVIDSTLIKNDYVKIAQTAIRFDGYISDSIIGRKVVSYGNSGFAMPEPIFGVGDKAHINEIEAYMHVTPTQRPDSVVLKLEDILSDKGYILKRKRYWGEPDFYIVMEKGDTVAEMISSGKKDAISFNLRTHDHKRKYEWGWNSSDRALTIMLNELDTVPNSELP